jgi:hypothetical protein
MHILDTEDLERLRALIGKFRMEAIADQLLRHAAPCITLLLEDVFAGSSGETVSDSPVGTSRMGGLPDAPADFRWPVFQCGYSGETVYSGFLMQVNLADMPLWSGAPLPRRGLLSVFHRDQCAPFRESFEVHWFEADPRSLHRAEPPQGMACASEVTPCDGGQSFALRGVRGIDAPDKGQDDWMREILHDRFAGDTSLPDWIERMSGFREHCLDPGREQRARDGQPFHRWHAGQLLGRLDRRFLEVLALEDRGEADRVDDHIHVHAQRDLLAREAGDAWKLLLQIESNAITGFAGGCDVAPVLIAGRITDEEARIRIDAIKASLAP